MRYTTIQGWLVITALLLTSALLGMGEWAAALTLMTGFVLGAQVSRYYHKAVNNLAASCEACGAREANSLTATQVLTRQILTSVLGVAA
jgi:hypothetical protein